MKHNQLRALWLVWLGLFLASGAWAQTSITTSSSATSGCATITTDTDKSTVGIQVTGTWTGTLQPQVAIQGQAAVNTQVTPTGSSTPQSTITANGLFTASVAGTSTFQICGPTGTGTALVWLNVSKAAVKVQGGGSGSGTVSANNGIAGANAIYAAAGGSTTVSPTSGLSYDSVGNATLAQGSIVVSTPAFSETGTWNAAGVAFTNWVSNITCTAAATSSIAMGLGVAGTQWQFRYGGATCASPFISFPAGTATNPSLAVQLNNAGINFTGGGHTCFDGGGNYSACDIGGGGLQGPSSGFYSWTATGLPTGADTGSRDTTLSRSAAGVAQVGTTANNSNGVWVAAAIRGGGAAAALTGTGACATFSGQVGASNVGQAACASATAASTLTITPGTTAPNGWVCNVQDETTRANLFQQTSHTATACTLTITSVTQNDVFVFTATQY